MPVQSWVHWAVCRCRESRALHGRLSEAPPATPRLSEWFPSIAQQTGSSTTNWWLFSYSDCELIIQHINQHTVEDIYTNHKVWYSPGAGITAIMWAVMGGKFWRSSSPLSPVYDTVYIDCHAHKVYDTVWFTQNQSFFYFSFTIVVCSNFIVPLHWANIIAWSFSSQKTKCQDWKTIAS